MAVDVDCCRLTWCIVSLWRCIVANERYDDSRITELILNVLHIDWIGEGLDAGQSLSVLILRLNKDDRTTVRDLGCGQSLA